MKKNYYRLFILCALIFALGTTAFAQKKKRKPQPRPSSGVISIGELNSLDFEPERTSSAPTVRKNRVKAKKKYARRCRRYVSRRTGKTYKRCRTIRRATGKR